LNFSGASSIHRWQEAKEEVVEGQGYVNTFDRFYIVRQSRRVVLETIEFSDPGR
jgi:hypothetical protein